MTVNFSRRGACHSLHGPQCTGKLHQNNITNSLRLLNWCRLVLYVLVHGKSVEDCCICHLTWLWHQWPSRIIVQSLTFSMMTHITHYLTSHSHPLSLSIVFTLHPLLLPIFHPSKPYSIYLSYQHAHTAWPEQDTQSTHMPMAPLFDLINNTSERYMIALGSIKKPHVSRTCFGLSFLCHLLTS